MGWYANLQRRLGHRRWFAALGAGVAHHLDRVLHRLTGGRMRATGRGLPALMLTTTGRRSGRDRTVPLLFARVGDRLVVAGSNWGEPHHPAWSGNLMSNPGAWVQVGPGPRVAYHARLVEGEERRGLWPLLVRMWPAYDTYEARSGRDIRVFVLEPEGPPDPTPRRGERR